MEKAPMINKMIEFYQGNIHDINHFLKVYAFARTIGEMEGLEPNIQSILEIEAIVHDISCPVCREKYGNANGKAQEAESAPLLQDFLEEYHLPEDVLNRILYVISHHHTYTNVDGMDYQILLEADFLVNVDESEMSRPAIEKIKSNVFKTKSGTHLLDTMYLNG